MYVFTCFGCWEDMVYLNKGVVVYLRRNDDGFKSHSGACFLYTQGTPLTIKKNNAVNWLCPYLVFLFYFTIRIIYIL